MHGPNFIPSSEVGLRPSTSSANTSGPSVSRKQERRSPLALANRLPSSAGSETVVVVGAPVVVVGAPVVVVGAPVVVVGAPVVVVGAPVVVVGAPVVVVGAAVVVGGAVVVGAAVEVVA